MLKESKNGMLEYQKLPKEEMERRGILGRLVGVCADFINPTRNGRKYPEELWQKVFDSDLMKEKIANRVCYGELGHPADREETDMEKVAICLAEQPVKGRDGKLRAVFDILNTKNGQILKTLCDYGSTLGISSRGSGDLITDYDGNESVDPDTYNCEGFDVVITPAVKEARLQYVTEELNKKRYGKTLRQSLTEALNKASDSDRKLMQESLDDLGIKLTESSIVTKGDSLQGEEEYEIVETAIDSLSNKTIYKIIDKEGKARWIPESDAKYIIGAPVQHEEPVEEEPIIEEPPVEELPVNESASEDLASYFNKWKEANPDVDLPALIDEYNGNLGSIMYSEAEFNKFADWAKSEHAIEINPIESDDFIDSLEEPAEEPVEAAPVEEVPEKAPEEEPVAILSLC